MQTWESTKSTGARGVFAVFAALLMLTVSAMVCAQPSADAGPDQSNVGFGSAVQLDASASTGDGPLTYLWEQQRGLKVSLSDFTSQMPAFTAPTMADMVLDHNVEKFDVLGIEPNFLEVAFLLTVTDANGHSDTDTITVSLLEPQSGDYFRTSGLYNVALGSPVYVHGPLSQETFNWELDGPFNSVAGLMDTTTRFPNFVPDVTGFYLLSETVSGESLEVHAAQYSGIRKCAACHDGGFLPDMVTPWSGTGHATTFEDAMEGRSGSHFQARCISCHVVGFDRYSDISALGFDDLADGFWEFPETLEPGNWDHFVEDYPELANLANVQCESCHGPGGDHFGELDTIDLGFKESVCGYCHNAGSYHVKNEQLRNSPHSTVVTGSPSERGSCIQCHTGQGFVQMIKGQELVVPERPEPQTCQTCHDPHHNQHEHQLRHVDTAMLPNGYEITDAGTGAICMQCHNSRRSAQDVLPDRARAPHGSTQADMLAGKNAMEIPGVEYRNSFHAGPDFVTYYFSDGGDDENNTCATCHMAANASSVNGQFTGEHSFLMRNEIEGQEVENLDACTICHVGLDRFDRRARGDYDGDGTLEGIQSEVHGLLEVVRHAIEESVGGSMEDAHGGIEFHDAEGNVVEPTEAQYIAGYNYFFVENDGSLGLHNTGYAVKLLQSAYENLTGHPVPNATMRKNDEPSFKMTRRRKF